MEKMIEVRTLPKEFWQMLAYGWGTGKGLRRRQRHFRHVQAAINPDLRIVFMRDRTGRWFPSVRRFILWHEFQHFRIRRRFQDRRIRFLLSFGLLDAWGFFQYPLWLIYDSFKRLT